MTRAILDTTVLFAAAYLYAFNDDVEVIEDAHRLDTATDPYDPN